MIQWKQIGQGAYVAGLEPATNWTIGRAAERAAGRLKFLEPGETPTTAWSSACWRRRRRSMRSRPGCPAKLIPR